MYKGIELSASLMCVDWLRAGEQLHQLEENGIDYIHLDIVDGTFAPDFTMGSSIIDCFRSNTKLRSDYHLMVEEPGRLFDTYTVTSDDYFTIHQESARNLHRELVRIRKKGAKVGVALSPGTSLDSLEYVIEDIDLVLLMSVNPGYKGQPLVPQVLRKIDKLRSIASDMNLPIKISVDGNVNISTAPEMVAAGADLLVLGSSGLFRHDMPISAAIEAMYHAIDEGLKYRSVR